MPGLLRGVARTAVVAGTATAVSNRVSRRQAQRWSDQAQPGPQTYEQPVAYQQPASAPAAQPASLGQDEMLSQLKQLGELKSAGVLTEEEFAMQKARILAGVR